MSGYSDKEYLKAAIKLKAINYIEKPLHPEEVQAAVLEAQTLYKQKLRSHRGEAIHSQEIATRLAQQLTLPPSDNNKIADLCLELGQPGTSENGMNFTSVIVKLNQSVEASGIFLEDLHNEISRFPGTLPSEMLFAEKEFSIWSTIYMEVMPFRQLHFPLWEAIFPDNMTPAESI